MIFTYGPILGRITCVIFPNMNEGKEQPAYYGLGRAAGDFGFAKAPRDEKPRMGVS